MYRYERAAFLIATKLLLLATPPSLSDPTAAFGDQTSTPPSLYTHAFASSPWASIGPCCSAAALSPPAPRPSPTTGSGDADSAVRCASAALALVSATRETVDKDGAVGGNGAGDGRRWDVLASAVVSEGAGEAAAEAEAEAPPAAGLALLARLPVGGIGLDGQLRLVPTYINKAKRRNTRRTRAAEDALVHHGLGLAPERLVALPELLHRLAHGPAVVELERAEAHARDGGGLVHGEPPLDGKPVC